MFEDRFLTCWDMKDWFRFCTSGMAAVSGAANVALKAGDHVVARARCLGRALYVLEG